MHFPALLVQYAWLVPLLPLVAAGVIGLRLLVGSGEGDAAEKPTAVIAQAAALGALALLLALDVVALREGAPGRLSAGTWFASGDVSIPLSFLLDALSLPLATLFAFIGWVTLRFSANYLHREPGFHRFYLVLCLFLAGMLLIVLAGNAVIAFVGWEMAGLSSYLLIGYAWDRPTATGNALWVFVANRIGDIGFVAAIALAFMLAGSVDWQAIAGAGGDDLLTARILALGFVLAALVKSAQLPFSGWIARALEGPTPSSAIFYGAVMVHAGVYLLLRLAPLLERAPDLMALLALVGLATALYGWFVGLVQTDVKSALIFGTVAQVGLMFLACGLGWFQLAAWHLGLHAAWRAYQFLMAPSYMHLVARPAKLAPGWLAGRQGAYTAALQRLWLDPLAQALLLRPARAVARDARDFDEQVLSHVVGMPDEARPEAVGDAGVIQGRGLAGRLLAWSADRLHRFEARLLLSGREGPALRALRRAGEWLQVVESLLERPRYLMLLVLVTFAVIL